MKSFSKMAVFCVCLLITALFTSACCGSGKATSTTYPYWLLTQNNQQQENNNQQQNNNNQNNNEENNNQQQEEDNNENNNQQNNQQPNTNQEEQEQQEENNNNEENNNQEENNQEQPNNEEEPVGTSDVTLTLTDSLQSDKIATADIFYKLEDKTKKTSVDDKKISQATPTADDNTKFVLTINENAKIKAIITYDSEGNFLDYFSNYNGIEATNGNFDFDFENSNGDFAGGEGTSDKPYLISQPRHFANINKYLDKHFKQTADIDFSHLTGLKIVTADEDKDITIEKTNEKAPFYNNGKGINPIGATDIDLESFQGNYDGDDHIIDGIIIVNPTNDYIGLFPIAENATIQNLTIGENSIFFIDELKEGSVSSIQIGSISGCLKKSTVDKCQNNSEVLITNLDANYAYCVLNIHGIAFSQDGEDGNSTIKNCKNTGNITISNCKIETTADYGTTIRITSNRNNNPNSTNNTNEGNINITNNQFSGRGNGNLTIENGENNYTNTGHITIDNNTNLKDIDISINKIYDDSGMNDCTNDGHITITNNQLDSGINGSIDVIDFYAYSFSNCINNGYIIINGNSDNYCIAQAMNIYGGPGATNNGKVTVNGAEGSVHNEIL